MRVVAGEYRGRRLRAPAGRDVRPTTDRVREALFGLAEVAPEGGAVLDLFAGSGALGVEALSRGAARAVFVERDARVAALIKENLRALSVDEARWRVLHAPLPRALARLKEPFDLVLADPPYRKGLAAALLTALAARPILLAREHLIVLETEPDALPAERVLDFDRVRHRRYGDTEISFWRRREDPA
jgi:16S rRNA (guanine966-N2)-methyltransferase